MLITLISPPTLKMTNQQIQYISQTVGVSEQSVKNTIDLFKDGATLPFVARYRKEVTGGLDEVQLADVKSLFEKLTEADKRREAIIKSIDEQGKLTDALLKKLNQALLSPELEDIYLPYKQKRKTRASIAVEKGLEPLAKTIFEQRERGVQNLAKRFLNKDVISTDEALQGARDIIAEWINEDIQARNVVRNVFEKTAIVTSKVKKGKQQEGEKFKDYFDYSEELKRIPSHRLLAIRRGENEGFLKVKMVVEDERALNSLDRIYLQGMPECKDQVADALEDAYKRLLSSSVENEFAKFAKEKADTAAIEIFNINLRQLLLSSPLGQKRVLAIDPGFRTGCKTVVISQQGDLLHDTVIFLTHRQQEAEGVLRKIVDDYKIEAIAIGNGTASRETESFIRGIASLSNLPIHVVSEQGASIYSASMVAREEFPNKDVTVRGAISIGRRLMDPLAELVKIDPKSIGVGQYQHDIEQKMLKESLDRVVESCVNSVGVELNTASKHLLTYVSGLGPTLAQNVVDYRQEIGKFKSRNELKKVPRLGAKAFEQAAGFLRINGAKNPLDNSAVHPESYAVVEQMAKDLGVSVPQLIESQSLRKSVDLKKYVTATIGLPTLTDILNELEKPGRDPREALEEFAFADVHKIEDLHVGMVLPGIVTNITAFGCFVDVGVHQDGLVHISQLANKFVKDASEVVAVHQKVKVKVMEVDANRKRIALSMKDI